MKFPSCTRALPSILTLVAATPVSSGCASRCERASAIRSALLGSRASSGPDVRLRIPFATLEPIALAELRAVRGARVDLPGVGDLDLGTLALRAKGLRFRPAARDRLGVEVTMVAELGGAAVELVLDAEAGVRVDPGAGSIEIELGPEQLRRVRPRFDPAQLDRLAAAIHRELPGLVRNFVGREQVRTLLGSEIPALLERSWPQLRDGLLADVGSLASFSIDLPDIPLRALTVDSETDALRLSWSTGLAGATTALGTEASKRRDLIELRIAAATATALANHAIDAGQLPDRYGEDGTADPKGPYRPRLSWRSGRRPLQVHVFGDPPACVYARISGTPTVAARPDGIEVAITDGRLDKVLGPSRLRWGAFAQRISGQGLEHAETLATGFELELGHALVRARAREASRAGDELVVLLDLLPVSRVSPARPPTSAPRSQRPR